jgi:hypothetical protein
MRGRRPRQREPWGKRPNGPATRYVRLFVYAILAVALIGRLSVSSRGAANEAYYRSSADAWALRGRTLATIEDVVTHAHPAAIGAAQSTHVHLPGGGYLCAWVAPRSKSEASRPAVWASRRDAIEEDPIGDESSLSARGEKSDAKTTTKTPWSAPFVLARAPGAPATHRDPALFFVDGVLRLHFRVGDEEDASPHAATSRDGGRTWSDVLSLRGENAGVTKSSAYDACAVGGALPSGRRNVVHSGERKEKGGVVSETVACVGAIDPETPGEGVTVLVSENDAGDRFTRAASVALRDGTEVTAASLWRHAEVSVAAGGRHITSLALLGKDGLVYRAESPDVGKTWGLAERLDPRNLDARAVPSGGVSVAAVGRRSLVMARVFFLAGESLDERGESLDSLLSPEGAKNARAVVRLRLSDDGGATWPLWLDVPVEGGCAKRLPDTDRPDRGADVEDAAETCGAPFLEPWPESAEGFTVTRGVGGNGGVAFAATSLRAFREGAAAGSDAEASSGSIGDSIGTVTR